MSDEPKKQGGRRPGAGRKPKPKPPDVADKGFAARILAMCKKPIHLEGCECEECEWWDLLHANDLRARLDARKYLTDKRDGKAVHNVNHIHDKPIELNVNLELGERLAAARKRAFGS